MIGVTKAVDCGKHLLFWKPSKQHPFFLVSVPKQMGIRASVPNSEAREPTFRFQTTST